MNYKSIPFIHYVTLAIKKYHELMDNTNRADAYRVVDIKFDVLNQCKVLVQLVGKSRIITFNPRELAACDELLEKFSKKDIRTIIYLATQEILKPKQKIIIQEFCEDTGQWIFKLKNSSHKNIKKTASDISLNKTLLNELSQEDAHVVGYMSATESILREKKTINSLIRHH